MPNQSFLYNKKKLQTNSVHTAYIELLQPQKLQTKLKMVEINSDNRAYLQQNSTLLILAFGRAYRDRK